MKFELRYESVKSKVSLFLSTTLWLDAERNPDLEMTLPCPTFNQPDPVE